MYVYIYKNVYVFTQADFAVTKREKPEVHKVLTVALKMSKKCDLIER